jgi:hypothetical protein
MHSGACSWSCSYLVQGEKPDSSQVMLTGCNLHDQEYSQVHTHTHTNNTDQEFSKDFLLNALIVI